MHAPSCREEVTWRAGSEVTGKSLAEPSERPSLDGSRAGQINNQVLKRDPAVSTFVSFSAQFDRNDAQRAPKPHLLTVTTPPGYVISVTRDADHKAAI